MVERRVLKCFPPCSLPALNKQGNSGWRKEKGINSLVIFSVAPIRKAKPVSREKEKDAWDLQHGCLHLTCSQLLKSPETKSKFNPQQNGAAKCIPFSFSCVSETLLFTPREIYKAQYCSHRRCCRDDKTGDSFLILSGLYKHGVRSKVSYTCIISIELKCG